MKFGIMAGILSQAVFGLLAAESLKTNGFSTEVGMFAFCVFVGFIVTLFCGSLKKSKEHS